MTTLRPRTLEDLRHDASAAWLWDSARGRIVWANGTGVSALGGESVFDLVDRPFDPHDPAVLAIRQQSASLQTGQVQTIRLPLPGGAADDMAVQCSLHLLADGRQGLLVVAEPLPRPVPAIAGDVAHDTLLHLPMAVLILDAAGHILNGNDAAREMLDLSSAKSLSDFASDEKAGALLAGLKRSAVSSAVLAMACKLGGREVRVTLSRLPTQDILSAILEDVTDRRALERSLQAQPAAAAPAGPAKAAPQDAFAQLAKSLQDTIERQSTARIQKQAEPVAGPVVDAAKPAPPVRAPRPAPDAAPAAAAIAPSTDQSQQASTPPGKGMPFVPEPVRQSFERTGEAILIGRGETPLFATTKAASLLGYDSAASLITDAGLWQHFKAVAQQPSRTSLPLQSGESLEVEITQCLVPWVSGPAEQIVIKRSSATVAHAAPPVAAQPVAAPAPVAAAVPAPLPLPVPLPAAVAPPPVAEPPEPAVAPAPAPAPAPAFAREVMETNELKAMLDVASDGIIALDEDGRILSFSAGAEAIFGMSQDDVVGRPFAELLSGDGRKAWRDYLAALRGPGLASVFNDGREFTAIVKQGGTVPLFVTLGKLQSPHSQASFCAVVRDITQWKRTEQELREAKEAAETASRQKSEFLAGISHEIRTPLNAILGFSDVMRTERFGELKNEKYRAYANDIHTSGTHLLALVNDLLDLSKVESGKLELDFTAVNVVDAAEHVLRLMSEEAARANVVVRKSFATGLPRVVADLRALRQVLLNLVSNAIKYTDAGGQVIVSALMEETGEVVLRVKDSGIGMDATQLQEALRPYVRVEAATRERQGTGLGLPLSKALVEANRAQFTIASEPGQGTLAEVRFPATRVLAE
jgi:PAS domain S-box-containing protein